MRRLTWQPGSATQISPASGECPGKHKAAPSDRAEKISALKSTHTCMVLSGFRRGCKHQGIIFTVRQRGKHIRGGGPQHHQCLRGRLSIRDRVHPAHDTQQPDGRLIDEGSRNQVVCLPLESIEARGIGDKIKRQAICVEPALDPGIRLQHIPSIVAFISRGSQVGERALLDRCSGIGDHHDLKASVRVVRRSNKQNRRHGRPSF